MPMCGMCMCVVWYVCDVFGGTCVHVCSMCVWCGIKCGGVCVVCVSCACVLWYQVCDVCVFVCVCGVVSGVVW